MVHWARDKIALIDHAFIDKVQTDPEFRQALVLDPETTLAYYRISASMEKKMRNALALLDELLLVLVKHYAGDPSLRKSLTDKKVRRVMLFAPQEATAVFELSNQTGNELKKISAMANTLFESVLAAWRT